ncbi:hypothetical protein [Ilumatobacter sp.]|uniref:hypothetical protein n=1 Tax=Ilumatobacter sp. TaxID=1967498 RepID=UPI003B52D786
MLVCTAVCVATALAGCGRVELEADVAPLAPGDAPDLGSDARSECVPLVVEDEYGNDVELDSCDVGGASAAAPGGGAPGRAIPVDELDRAVAGVPSSEARDALDAALVASSNLARRCDDPDAWAVAAVDVADAIVRVADLVTADVELEDWRGGDDADRIGDALRDRLLLADGCASTPGDADEIDAVVAAAGRVAGANDDVAIALRATAPVVFGSDLWYNANALVHLIDLARVERRVDVLMMGPSTALRGFDPLAVTGSTGRETYNAGLGALPLDLQGWWYEMLTGTGWDAVDPSTVVLGFNTWIAFRACEDEQIAAVASAAELRARAYESVGLGDVAPALRIIGGREPTYTGAVLDANREVFGEGAAGRAVIAEEFDPETFDLQLEINTARQSFGAEACVGRSAAERALIDAIVADGREVLLVVLPTSDAMADLHPDGRRGHDAIVARYREIAAEVGGDLLDLSDATPEDLFVDLTHLDSAGRALISERVAGALGS